MGRALRGATVRTGERRGIPYSVGSRLSSCLATSRRATTGQTLDLRGRGRPPSSLRSTTVGRVAHRPLSRRHEPQPRSGRRSWPRDSRALHQVWLQQCGDFHLKPADLLKRFDGKEISGYRSKPFEVIYYRTRDEYNDGLRRQQPRIDMTLGIYFDDARADALFCRQNNEGGQDAGTIYHEAVHQFFQESTRAARNVAATSNAWLIEGVACYFESLTEAGQSADGVRYTNDWRPDRRPPAGRAAPALGQRLLRAASRTFVAGDQAVSGNAPICPGSTANRPVWSTFLMQHDGGKYRTRPGENAATSLCRPRQSRVPLPT